MANVNILKNIENLVMSKRNLFQIKSEVYEGIIKVDSYVFKDLKIEFYYCDERLRHVVIKSQDLNITISEDTTKSVDEVISYLKQKLES
ncbi:hypothetical protein V6M85_07875 [Sulfolobus tengchongensis]|uniref:Uncharacterized protein n=1 Tax=Sulfolobus tengchongensis TaxID=207809 RepID=A0AAX4KXT3_9CREN